MPSHWINPLQLDRVALPWSEDERRGIATVRDSKGSPFRVHVSVPVGLTRAAQKRGMAYGRVLPMVTEPSEEVLAGQTLWLELPVIPAAGLKD